MGVGPTSLFLLYLFFCFFSHARKFTSIYIYKNIKNTIRNPNKLPECHCIGKRRKYTWISQKITKMPLWRVWLMLGYCWRRWNFPTRLPANKWLILVDLRDRILMKVVSTAVDGWRGRIVGLKLRVADEIAAFFQPDGEEKTLKAAGVLLYRRLATFLWWLGGFTRPEMGDRMRERESLARGERDFEVWLRCEREHGTPVQLKAVNGWIADELILRLWLAWSASWSDGPDGLIFDLVWRGVPIAGYTGWRGTTGSKGRLF